MGLDSGGRFTVYGVRTPQLIVSALLSAGITGGACAAAFVTTSSEAVSLLVEPFSLLLVPGLATGILFANLAKPFRPDNGLPTHDFMPRLVVIGSMVFYFVFFVAFFSWRARRRESLTSSATSV